MLIHFIFFIQWAVSNCDNYFSSDISLDIRHHKLSYTNDFLLNTAKLTSNNINKKKKKKIKKNKKKKKKNKKNNNIKKNKKRRNKNKYKLININK